jgi:membrane-bound ClpP family serine protease
MGLLKTNRLQKRILIEWNEWNSLYNGLGPPGKDIQMEALLLNANVAYVVLVLGFVLALLAIVTPGTGMLEVGAFFCLAISAYQVYVIGFNLWAIVILILAVFPFVYAIRKPKREWALAVSILGIIVGSLFLYTTEGWRISVNPIVAIVTSLVSAGLLWLIVRKAIAALQARPSHNLGALIGQVGEAKTEVHAEGSVQVAGELWSARSAKEIPAGKSVRVIGREGFVLIVEKSE